MGLGLVQCRFRADPFEGYMDVSENWGPVFWESMS